MKSKFLRMLALILVLSSLISMFAIFASAEESDSVEDETEGTEEEGITLLYNRNYGEGWNVDNGMEIVDQGSTGSTTFTIESEGTNYFWRLELNSSDNDYAELYAPANTEIGTVFEFDVKSDVDCNFTEVINLLTTDGATSLCFMKVENNQVYFMNGTEPAFEIGNTWTRIQVVCDYTYVVYTEAQINAMPDAASKQKATLANENTFRMYIYYGPADGSGRTVLYNSGPLEVVGEKGKGIEAIRFQSTENDKPENYGSSICFDNIKLYDGANELKEITSEMGYGLLVDANKDLDFNPEEGAGGSSADLSTALSMKVGVNYCYFNNEKAAIAVADDGTVYGAPVDINGVIMIPLDKVLEYIGYTCDMQPDGNTISIYPSSEDVSGTQVDIVIGDNVAFVGANNVALTAAPGYVTDENGNSYVVISLDDVSRLFAGYYSDYDEMGYMTVSKKRNMLDRENNLNAMVSTMKKFVFDYYTPESIYNDVKENTNNFKHPYILANGEQLDALYDEYQALKAAAESGALEEGSDEYWIWIQYERIVGVGESSYKFYAKKDQDGTYDTFAGVLTDDEYAQEYGKDRGTGSLKQNYIKDYVKEPGYDFGMRSDIAERTSRLESLAYAYVLTKDVKYIKLAYEVALLLGKWTHWGPKNFVNCADASDDFALFYDWTYNGYVALKENGVKRADGTDYDVSALAEILMSKGITPGYEATKGGNKHITPVADTENGNYTVAVGVGGMTVAALAVLGDISDERVTEVTYMLSENFKTLTSIGLDCYAPDGAYKEGLGYWNYGTNSLFRMAAALDSAAGQNYGLMDSWGMLDTCYFAVHTEDNDSHFFPFHDATMGSNNTDYFFYVAKYFDDATLYDIRLNQIKGSVKRASIIDMLYYPRDIEIGENKAKLDYYSDSADIFATRSSWEKGALFASIAGGSNSASHGQIDAGSFVYHNGGNVWIYDLGTENHDAPGIWPSATRYRYYVMKPEGNNTIAITTDPKGTPYGQVLGATANAKKWDSNEHGSYVVYNMGGTLGTQVSKWERGMLLTNDRKTTVIQDQIAFKSFQKVYWFAHYSTNYVDGVTLSEDGRTAYMREYIGKNEHGEDIYQTLRLSIVSANQSYKFEIMDCYTFLHTTKTGFTSTNSTYSPEDIVKIDPNNRENSRQNYKKLAICSGEALDFNIAVAIELIDTDTVGKKTEIDVGYTYDNMNNWNPSADVRGLKIDTENTIIRRGIPKIDKHFVQSLLKIEEMKARGTLYTSDVEDNYRALTDAYYVVRTLGADMPSEYNEQKTILKEYREAFAAYRKAVSELQKDQLNFNFKLMGLM